MLKWNSESHIQQVKVQTEELRLSVEEAAEGMRQLSEAMKFPLTDYERGLIDGHRALTEIRGGG